MTNAPPIITARPNITSDAMLNNAIKNNTTAQKPIASTPQDPKQVSSTQQVDDNKKSTEKSTTTKSEKSSNDGGGWKYSIMIIVIIIVAIIIVLAVLYMIKERENISKSTVNDPPDIEQMVPVTTQSIPESTPEDKARKAQQLHMETEDMMSIIAQSKSAEVIDDDAESVNDGITDRTNYFNEQYATVSKNNMPTGNKGYGGSDATGGSNGTDMEFDDESYSSSGSSISSPTPTTGKKVWKDFTVPERKEIVKEVVNTTKKSAADKYNINSYQLNKILDDQKNYYNQLKAL